MPRPDNRDNRNQEPQDNAFEERVISVDRVARVVKGGRRFRFRALVVIGDKQGRVGAGTGKGSDVQSAIGKAINEAKKTLVTVPLYNQGTIPHELTVKHGGARIMIKPAGPGTGIIAGGALRDIFEAAGITDILSKNLGSSNKINAVYAALEGLRQLDDFGKGNPDPGHKPETKVATKEKS